MVPFTWDSNLIQYRTIEGVVLLLALESSDGNADPRYRFRRIVLATCDSQHMFYRTRGNATALRQDKFMEAAALMVRGAVPWVDR